LAWLKNSICLNRKKPVDVLFTLDENEWNNEKHLQLRVIDFRLAEENITQNAVS